MVEYAHPGPMTEMVVKSFVRTIGLWHVLPLPAGPRLYPDLCLDLNLGLVPGPTRWLETLHISGDNLHLRQMAITIRSIGQDHGEIILHRRMASEPGPAHQIPPRTRKRA